jgi:hypothetical protein
VPRRRWYDPITSYGFEFETLGNDLFTDIFDFPTGIDKFTITDISGLGPTPETAFPILLDFNNETVDFTMTRLDLPGTTPVPESESPYTWLALGVFISGLLWTHR